MSRGRFSLAALVLLLIAFTLGCASDSKPLWADPGVIRFAPEWQRWILKARAGDLSDAATPSINYRWSYRRYTWRQDQAGAIGLAICG